MKSEKSHARAHHGLFNFLMRILKKFSENFAKKTYYSTSCAISHPCCKKLYVI